MEKSAASHVFSIKKAKHSVLKDSDKVKTSDEYSKKPKTKKVHFSDVIEVCIETFSRKLAEDGSELLDLFEVPLNQRNMKKIQMLHTADYLNVKDFQEKYNWMHKGRVMRQCHQKQERNLMSSRAFPAPLATMEEVSLFCNESSDSCSNNSDNLRLMPQNPESVENHGSLVLSGFIDSKDHRVGEIITPLSSAKDEITVSETLNQCDEHQLVTTNDKNLLVSAGTLPVLRTIRSNSSKIVLECPVVASPAMQHEHAVKYACNLMENVYNSLLIQVPNHSSVEAAYEPSSTDAFPLPNEDHKLMTESALTAKSISQIQVNNDKIGSEFVFPEMESAVSIVVHKMSSSMSSPVAGEALRSSETLTETDHKESELLLVEDFSSISNPSSKSDEMTALMEDFVEIDDVVIDLEGIQDDFVIVDEIPEIHEFVLIDHNNVCNMSHKKSFLSGEELWNTQGREELVITDEGMENSGFVAEETRSLRGQCLEPNISTRFEVLVPEVSYINTEKCDMLEFFIREETRESKWTIESELQNCVMTLMSEHRSINSCYTLRNFMADSIDNQLNLSSGKQNENFVCANSLNSSNNLRDTNCPTKLPSDKDSSSEHSDKIQMDESSLLVDTRFKCVLIPNLVWFFRCNFLQWEMDSAYESWNYEESNVRHEEITKCMKVLKRQSSDYNLQMSK